MIFHKSRWQKNIKTFDDSLDYAEEFHLSNKIVDLLRHRGLASREAFQKYLNPDIKDLYDPFLLKGMNILVDEVTAIKENNGKIVIYGDYDVDGITSISLLYLYLKSVGISVAYYIPNRFDEGYGINSEALDKIKEMGCDLLITVDCGITSVAEAAHAKKIGLPLIITDHHECQEALPDCLCIINPKQSDCDYPFDMLAGAGIALKIVQALSGDAFSNIYHPYMEISAIGTIADIAPLVDENRIIAKHGLKSLENTKNIGLKSLLEVADLTGKELNSGHIGFGLGPRLNAAGRVDSAELGVKLLTTNSLHEGQAISEELNQLNKQRQEMEQSIIQACIDQVETHKLYNDKILVLSGEGWHTGVIGIVASRIAERYYKPTIILNIENGVAKGSARSVGDFSIFDAMHRSKALFDKFGGHKAAAGVSMPEKNVGQLKIAVNKYADDVMTSKDFYPRLTIEAEVSSADIAHDFAESIDSLKPFGLGNPKPCFVYNGLIVDTVRWLGKEQQHLKMSVHDGSRVYDCIKFNGSDDERKIRTGDEVDVAFTLDINKFRGVETLQFALKDVFIKNRITSDFEEKYFINLIDYLVKTEAYSDDIVYQKGNNIAKLFEEIEICINKSQRFILSVGSIHALKQVEQFFIDHGFEQYDWGFGHISSNQSCVIIHPYEDVKYKDAIAYSLDMLDTCEGAIFSTEEERKEYKVAKEKLTVQLSIFKFLYKELVNLKEQQSLNSLGKEMKLPPYIIYLAAKVFEEKGLMDITYKEGVLNVVKVNKPSQKVDLTSSKILKRIDGL